MNIIYKNNGYTFLELLILFGVGSIMAYVVSQFIVNQYSGVTAFEKQDIMRQLIAENVVEVNGTLLSQLPDLNSCRVRIYKTRGAFVSENNYSPIGGSCEPNIAIDEISVVWKVTKPQTAAPAEITFTPAASLKLPEYANTLRQFEIIAKTKDSMAFNNQSIIIFRK
ncbi:MAG: hypothetical protein ACOYOK_03300 [Pseudobdellovibrionaceae bacterium]